MSDATVHQSWNYIRLYKKKKEMSKPLLLFTLLYFLLPFISSHTVQIRAQVFPNGTTIMYALSWEQHRASDFPAGSMIIDSTSYRFTGYIRASTLPRNTVLVSTCAAYADDTYATNMFYQIVIINGLDWTPLRRFSFTRGQVEQEGCPEVLVTNLFLLAPIVEYFTPTSACYGQTIHIFGTQYENTTGVTIGNSPALSFSVINSTYVQAVVGSGTSGNVTLLSSKGSNPRTGFTKLVGASCPVNAASPSPSSSFLPMSSFRAPVSVSTPATPPTPISSTNTASPIISVVNGPCNISPSNGLAFSTYFHIDCRSLTINNTSNSTYSLRFFDEEIQQMVLLYDITSQPQMSLPLPPGYGSLFNLTVIVNIYNSTNSRTDHPLRVNVRPSTPLQLSSTLEFAKTNLQVLTNTIGQGKLQESQALLISMIQLLNRKDETTDNCFNNCSSNGYCNANGKCICNSPWEGTDCSLTAAQKTDRENIRATYLQSFLNLISNTTASNNSTDYTNQRNSYIISIITSAPQELDSQVQNLAIRTIDQIASVATDETSFALLLKSLSNTISNNLTRDAASPYVNSLTKVVDLIGRTNFVGDRSYKEANLEVTISKMAPNSWTGKFVALGNSSVFLPASVLPNSVIQAASSIEVRTVLLKRNPYVSVQTKEIHSYILDVKLVVDGREFSLQNLNEDIVLTIPGNYDQINYCTFWNNSATYWDTTGCKVTIATRTSLTCSCNHATEFAGQTSASSQDAYIILLIVIGIVAALVALVIILALGVFGMVSVGTIAVIQIRKTKRAVHPKQIEVVPQDKVEASIPQIPLQPTFNSIPKSVPRVDYKP